MQYDAGEKVNDKEPRNEEQHAGEMVLPQTVLIIPDHYTHPRTHIKKTEFCNEAYYVKKEQRLWARAPCSRD